MLTSDLYAKHMLPAKPEGECSGSDCLRRGMLNWLHCSSSSVSTQSSACRKRINCTLQLSCNSQLHFSLHANNL